MKPGSSAEIFFSVGEPSGDLHAASLIDSFRQCVPISKCSQLRFRGLGGSRMRAAGCNIDFPLTDLAVIGLLEVLPKLREFFRVADLASEVFASNRPDAVILVDFPGFNWHIAKRAKQHGIPVFYYLPPQLWAWGSWRVEKMKRYVDHVLCNLPFEHEWYASRGVSADFVGHPFLDVLDSHPLDKAFLESWGQHEGLQVAVLPGSREREVRNIWPMQLAAIRELSRRHGKTRYLIACLNDQHAEQCRSLLTEEDRKLDLHFFVDRTSEIIDIADCSLMKSGSVSLEMMARGTPAVVLYHVSRSLDFARKRLANVNSMTLPNLIAGRTIMPEFLAVGSDRQATIERCIAAMDRLLGDRDERLRQRGELLELRRICGPAGASGRAASIVLQRLGLSPAIMEPSFNAPAPRVAA